MSSEPTGCVSFGRSAMPIRHGDLFTFEKVVCADQSSVPVAIFRNLSLGQQHVLTLDQVYDLLWLKEDDRYDCPFKKDLLLLRYSHTPAQLSKAAEALLVELGKKSAPDNLNDVSIPNAHPQPVC